MTDVLLLLVVAQLGLLGFYCHRLFSELAQANEDAEDRQRDLLDATREQVDVELLLENDLRRAVQALTRNGTERASDGHRHAEQDGCSHVPQREEAHGVQSDDRGGR